MTDLKNPFRIRRLAKIAAAVAGAALVLTACAGKASPEAKEEPAAAVELPTTPVGEATEWVLGEMNADDDTTEADWRPRIDEKMNDALTDIKLVEIINAQIRPARPLVPTAVREGGQGELITTIAGALGDPFDLTLTVDDKGLISGLLLSPVTPPRAAATSLDEVKSRLAALDMTVRTFVTYDDRVFFSSSPDDLSPVGSIFKLYVLTAVADAVTAGSLHWDQELEVTDGVRSLPSGELQDAPSGTKVSVRDAALKMISISDNTATDMLIAAVGRDAVEAAVVAAGHSTPEAMRPFLTTREAFTIAWGEDKALAAQWAAADEAARRAILATVDAASAGKPLPIDAGSIDLQSQTLWGDEIEWFASANDIAAVHAALAARAATDPTITDVLTANSGIKVSTQQWPSTAFKGGSSPGVVAGSWRAVDGKGRVLTVVLLGSSDDPAAVNAATTELFGLAGDIFTLVGTGTTN